MIQVIRWLTMGLAAQTKAEKRFCEETPLERPTDDSAIRAAICLLRAAGKIHKAQCLNFMSDVGVGDYDHDDSADCFGPDPWADQIRALLAALPDKEQ